jgi:hypothetical protein
LGVGRLSVLGEFAAWCAYADAVKQAVARVGAIVVATTVMTALIAASVLMGSPHVASAESGSKRYPDVTRVSSASAHLRFTLPTSSGTAYSPNNPNLADRTIRKSPMVLFLAATRARPMDYRSFISTAAGAGYHVLALDYTNTGRSVQATCRAKAACYTAVQRNRLDGSHSSAFSSVRPADSILARLRSALRYLRANDPNGGWGRYLNGSTINWSRIVVAGHSQGGGESAYISHLHKVRGALMFASPVETTNGVAASWMHKPGKTSASRLYAFDSDNDMFFSKIRGSWTMLGMDTFGAPQTIVAGEPLHSHELLSARDIGNKHESHSRTITDNTPRSHGVPVFRSVWKWMLAQLYTRPASAHTADSSKSP